MPFHRWIARAAVHEPTHDRRVLTAIVGKARVCEPGGNIACSLRAMRLVVGCRAFETVPAKVRGQSAERVRQIIDLFPAILPVVPDPEVAGLAVETKTPGISQAECKYLSERVVARQRRTGVEP